jgi:hypothetical protein
MKIYIGPYKNWFGPYHCARLLRHVGCSDDFCDWLATFIPARPFDLINRYRKQRIKIKIHAYDTWSMDYTLALIIHPMLLQLKATKHGSPYVDDEDVPESIRSTAAGPKEHEWDTDEFFFQRWDYVLDEMIFAFSMKLDEDWIGTCWISDDEKDIATRIKNGLRLFGKYYGALWD